MSQTDLRPVAESISAVVSAYTNAASLVQRIKLAGDGISSSAMADLEDSLALGPPIVKGQYENDFHRIGQAYASGDQAARECLRDIVVNLQLTLISTLHTSLLDNLDLDYGSLLDCSDNGRVEAIVCLSQLSRRLAPGAAAKPAAGVHSPLSTASTPVEMSTDSQIMEAPHEELFRVPVSRNLSSAGNRSNPRSPISPTMESDFVTGYAESVSPATRDSRYNYPPNRTPTSLSRGSMQSIDVRSNYSDPIEGPRYFQHRHQFRNNALNHSRPTINEYSAPGPSDIHSNAPQALGPRTFQQRPTPPPSGIGSRSPYDTRTDLLSPSSSKRTSVASDIQPPTSPPTNTNMWSMGSTFKKNGPHGPDEISVDDSTSAPRPLFSSITTSFRRKSSVTATRSSRNNSAAATLGDKDALHEDHTGLYLPNEENKFAGFCKGAWKLQMGMKKAMLIEQRPAGMYAQIQFWRCSKCCFEGPLGAAMPTSPFVDQDGKAGFSRTGPVDKPARAFDQRVRVHRSTGIRYRWAFLAKCHVYCKDVPKSTDGSSGSFGCIYCCSDMKSSAPVFTDVDRFMEHLRMHDGEMTLEGHTWSPSEEMLNRTKCIMGRVAQNWEEFDLNIPPALSEVGD